MSDRLADVWRELGMVDDPAKEISLFFEQMERLHKNAHRYIKLVSKAYESYGEDLKARMINKKQKDLHRKVMDLLDLGDSLVNYADDLDDMSRQQVAGTKPMDEVKRTLDNLVRVAYAHPEYREALLPVIKRAREKYARGKVHAEVVNMAGQQGIRIVWTPNMTVYGGKVDLESLHSHGNYLLKEVDELAKKEFRDRTLAGGDRKVDLSVRDLSLVTVLEIENPLPADAELIENELRM